MLDETDFPSPESILSVGLRRLTGQVLAAWNGNHLLVRSTNQVIHTIEIADSHLPACGQWIETVGILETDLYHLNLSNAIWRPIEWDDKSNDKPIDISPAQLLTDGKGNSMLHSEYNGQCVRITGVVQDISLPRSHSPSFLLKDGHVTITVRADACPQAIDNLSAGSHVILTGICVLKTTNWHSYARFPHATELFIALQKASDVTITAQPPWWTPARLAAVIGALLSLLVGFVAWNWILNRLVNRRSRELFHEQVAHYGATLRIDERTRLAVELHDSLSQVLTAVAMEIEAVRQTALDARPETNLHLDIAQKTLSSCRTELRNCLWDLRNLALDEPDMNMAIRKTLLPHIKNIKTAIRFNIPRARFSDNTIHSILQIIRELTVNAIRHGNATFIQIAGGIEGDLLKFSVTNDGAPFDINACPGVTQGHFGLQGIRERLRKLEGTLSVSCSTKRGVRVKVTMKILQPSTRKTNDL